MTGQKLWILIFVYMFQSHEDDNAIDAAIIPDLYRVPEGRTSIIVPLSYNNSRSYSPLRYSNIRRRHRRSLSQSELQLDRSTARLGLYDGLVSGYYTTQISIGTPPQTFSLIVDSGSTITYVPCATCEQCGTHEDPKFRPDLSSSYQQVKCNIDCICDDARKVCAYEREYAEMSSSSGILSEDVISFGNFSGIPPQRAVFGCENEETGDLYSQHADGIMGLGRGDNSIVDQLVGKGVINDSFSLCYGGMHGGGSMILGRVSAPDDMVFAHSDPNRSPYYNVDLKEIHVAGKRLPLNPEVFDGRQGTILDSGTTFAYLPQAAFTAFRDAIITELQFLKRISGPDPDFNDLCFTSNGSILASDSFPAVEMVFGNGHKLSLSPENYLFQHSKVKDAYCLGVFGNGKDPTTLLGGIIVRNIMTVYDREHSKIGFWKTNCTELRATLMQKTDFGLSPELSPFPKSASNGSFRAHFGENLRFTHYIYGGLILVIVCSVIWAFVAWMLKKRNTYSHICADASEQELPTI